MTCRLGFVCVCRRAGVQAHGRQCVGGSDEAAADRGDASTDDAV